MRRKAWRFETEGLALRCRVAGCDGTGWFGGLSCASGRRTEATEVAGADCGTLAPGAGIDRDGSREAGCGGADFLAAGCGASGAGGERFGAGPRAMRRSQPNIKTVLVRLRYDIPQRNMPKCRPGRQSLWAGLGAPVTSAGVRSLKNARFRATAWQRGRHARSLKAFVGLPVCPTKFVHCRQHTYPCPAPGVIAGCLKLVGPHAACMAASGPC